jgi:lipopolysaccharide biosynthesis glycosyltransferase
MLELSITTLRNYNPSIDVLIIADKMMEYECKKRFPTVQVVTCDDSISAMDSSMKKLQIFKYDISKYDKVLFIDSDILVFINLKNIFNRIKINNLYACAEHKTDLIFYHQQKYHSLLDYTEEQLTFLKDNNIHVFNAGLFGFLNTPDMKEHFDNVLDLIEKHKDNSNYWYEQSFMNVYFNLRNLTDLTVINDSNYILNFESAPVKFYHQSLRYKNKILHFSLHRTSDLKLSEMRRWYNTLVV